MGRKSLIQHIFRVLNGRIWSQLQRTNLSEASFQLQVQAQQFLAFCFFASVVFLRVLRFPRSSQINLKIKAKLKSTSIQLKEKMWFFPGKTPVSTKTELLKLFLLQKMWFFPRANSGF